MPFIISYSNITFFNHFMHIFDLFITLYRFLYKNILSLKNNNKRKCLIMNFHPLAIDGFIPLLCTFVAIISLSFVFLVSEFSFFALILFLLSIILPFYISSQKKKRIMKIVYEEIQESKIYQTRAHHPSIKNGYLGITKNYLFFIPDKKSEQPIIIRGEFLNQVEIAPFNSGNYLVQNTKIGAVGSNIKWQAFHCSGVTSNHDSFTFSWILPSSMEGKKLMKKIGKMENVDLDANGGKNRKLI